MSASQAGSRNGSAPILPRLRPRATAVQAALAACFRPNDGLLLYKRAFPSTAPPAALKTIHWAARSDPGPLGRLSRTGHHTRARPRLSYARRLRITSISCPTSARHGALCAQELGLGDFARRGRATTGSARSAWRTGSTGRGRVTRRRSPASPREEVMLIRHMAAGRCRSSSRRGDRSSAVELYCSDFYRRRRRPCGMPWRINDEALATISLAPWRRLWVRTRRRYWPHRKSEAHHERGEPAANRRPRDQFWSSAVWRRSLRRSSRSSAPPWSRSRRRTNSSCTRSRPGAAHHDLCRLNAN